MDERGQGALEYLLLIAAALLVAAAVTWILFQTASPTTNKIGGTTNKFFNALNI